MKLPIKDKWFNEIKNGNKWTEIRDAHITFVNEKTGEKLTKKVFGIEILSKDYLPTHLRKSKMFDDEFQIYFKMGD